MNTRARDDGKPFRSPGARVVAPEPKKKVDLSQTPARVARIHIDGVSRTKDDFVSRLVKEAFSAATFQDLVFEAFNITGNLERLGIVKQCGVFLDTSPDGPTDYELTLNMEESRRVTGSLSTLIGTNEGSLLLGLKLPNTFGRAERVQLEYSHGSKNSGGQYLTFSKPFGSDLTSSFVAGVFQNHCNFPWSGYMEKDRGLFFEFTAPSAFGEHSLRWDGTWRDLRCLNRSTALPVRLQAGHTLKSALKHTFKIDSRDSAVLPNSGSLLKLTQELAGLGGDAQFLKHDLELQFNRRLWLDTVVQLGLAGGFIMPVTWVGRPKSELHVTDKFFLGGPLTLRGFNMRSAGPEADGNFLGANSYWQCGLHVYTPLPFRPGKNGFGELFRTHFFCNLGNAVDIKSPYLSRSTLRDLTEATRISYGVGLVLRLGGVARLELNYCFPYRFTGTDSINRGLQFGLGLSFL